jgi:hypothetical protein
MPFITYYHCNVGQEPRPISDVGLAFRPVFIPNSNFIIPHFILTPLSLSPSCRRPVPLQEGPRWLQHPGRGIETKPLFVCPRPSDASPGPGAAGVAAPEPLPAPPGARPPALAVSDDEEGADLIAAGAGDNEAQTSPILTLETLPSAGRA